MKKAKEKLLKRGLKPADKDFKEAVEDARRLSVDYCPWSFFAHSAGPICFAGTHPERLISGWGCIMSSSELPAQGRCRAPTFLKTFCITLTLIPGILSFWLLPGVKIWPIHARPNQLRSAI